MADEADDTIHSALAAALATAEGAQAAAGAAPEKPAADAQAADSTADAGDADEIGKPERARGPDGKFLKAEDAEAGAKEKPAVDDKTQKPDTTGKPAGKQTGESDPEPKTEGKLEAPRNWSKQQKELFGLAPENIQRFMLEREKQIDREFTRIGQEHAEFRKTYDPVDKIFAPYRQIMQERNLSPASLVQAWASVEQRLTTDPVGVIKGLVAGYRVDLHQLAQALGLTAEKAPADSHEQSNGAAAPAQLPPQLVAELRELRQRQDAFDSERQRAAAEQRQQAEQRVVDAIQEFKGATDGKGNLLHAHFEEVEAAMTRIALGYRARQEPVPPLQALYDEAVWANPSTREKVRTAETQATERKRAEEARAKAAKAQRAGSSVTGAPGSGQPLAKQTERTLREELEAAADAAA